MISTANMQLISTSAAMIAVPAARLRGGAETAFERGISPAAFSARDTGL